MLSLLKRKGSKKKQKTVIIFDYLPVLF